MKKRNNAVTLYGFLFSFVLSFVFEGRVYYQLVIWIGYDASYQNLIAMFCHMLGLIYGGLLIKSHMQARKCMRILIVLCIVITPLFLIPQMFLGCLVIGTVAFLSGMAVVCWGSFYKYCIPAKERLKSMADALILANILMITAGLVSTFLSAIAGFILSLGYLVIAFLFLDTSKNDAAGMEKKSCQMTTAKSLRTSMQKSMILLALFTIVITIDAGLMYGVIQTQFQSLDILVSWYWAVPYILVLFVLRNIAADKSSSLYIYIAIGMVVAGFVAYLGLAVSTTNYICIDSLLLGAAGILDLFWSSIVGETLEYSDRPVAILGIGWSANVCGVLIGGIFSQLALEGEWSKSVVTIFALVIACFSLMIVPEMLRYLRMLLKNHMYLSVYLEAPIEQKKAFTTRVTIQAELTAREKETLDLILLGKSNKEIAEAFCISENTVKTHVRNILGKYEVQNRIQLISKIMQKI